MKLDILKQVKNSMLKKNVENKKIELASWVMDLKISYELNQSGKNSNQIVI